MSSYPVSGERLSHFRIVRKLGQGGMGAVFEAEDERLGRRVALKLLPAEFVGAREHRARFLREARAAAAVEHRSIATVHEIGEDGDRVFIAMELVRGQSLRERLAEGPLSLAEALRITVEVTKGLAKAHAIGVVHRDLKPDNVMLSADGEVKILDFGIAKSVDASAVTPDGATAMPTTEAGRALGTPGYMSPEQAQGQAVDARTDLFAVGTLLFELCTGERAFVGDTPLALMIATVQQESPRLTAQRPGAPLSVERLVLRCLAKEPDERIGSAEALLAELERVSGMVQDAESAATIATPPLAVAETGDAAHPHPHPQRRRARFGLATVMALGAIAGFGVWRHYASETTSSTQTPAVAQTAVQGIACPVLEESAPGLPAGWLGAAAASLTCSDLTLVLGVDATRTRIPAELLDLPTQVTDDFPKNPFGEPGTRQRSFEAARAAGHWVDGRVEIARGAFRLTMTLQSPAGPMGEPIQAVEPTLHDAVFSIVDRWIGAGYLVAQPPSASVARVHGCADLRCLRNAAFARQLLLTTPDRSAACEDLKRAGGYARWLASGECGVVATSPPDLAEDQPLFLAVDGLNHAVDRSTEENAARAKKLGTAQSPEMPPPLAQFLRLSEAELRAMSGDSTAARTLADQALVANPRSCSARRIAAFTAADRSSRPGIVAIYAAWCPWQADAYADRNWSDEDTLAFARLTVQLSSPAPTYAPWLAYELLRREQREEARGLASQLMDGSDARRQTGIYIMALVEADEGRLRASVRRLEQAMMSQERYPKDSTTEVTLLSALLITEVLGTDADLAGAFVQRFLLAEPARIERGTPYLVVAHAAMRAPEPIALAGLKRIRGLLDSGVLFGKGMGDDAYLGGAERFVRGDAKGAVVRWRPLAAAAAFQFNLPPEAFDRAGEPELAASMDQFRIERAWRMGLAFVREAHRAAGRGEVERAKQLAQRVVDKWATADADVPYVKDMRALLARLESQ